MFGYFFQYRHHRQRDAGVASEKDQMANARHKNSRGPVGVLPEEGITWGNMMAAFKGLEPAL